MVRFAKASGNSWPNGNRRQSPLCLDDSRAEIVADHSPESAYG
jgi:hypothetical protein